MYKAYKYRLYPNREQEQLILQHIGCCRFIYNYGLNKKMSAYQTDKSSVSRFQIQADLPILKKQTDTSFLKNVNSLSLQAALACLDNAFTRFFKEKKGFPKFKSKKDGHQSFIIPQNTKVDFESNRIFIPKFKQGIKCKLHRTFDGIIKSSTISKTPTGKYFISILVETNEVVPNKKPCCENQAVGIDLGIKTFATLSDNTKIDNPRNLKKSLKKLKKLQREVSRKKKGSNNRNKAVKKLALMHEKVTNRRNDFLHKVTHELVCKYDTICLETLSSKNMMKNHKLAQALSDIAIGRFNELIDYKGEWYGINILRIGRFEPSSKMCTCGYVNKELKLSERIWTCPECGAVHDRDLLAANNIKRFSFCKNNTAGTAEIHACGDMSDVSCSTQEASSFKRV